MIWFLLSMLVVVCLAMFNLKPFLESMQVIGYEPETKYEATTTATYNDKTVEECLKACVNDPACEAIQTYGAPTVNSAGACTMLSNMQGAKRSDAPSYAVWRKNVELDDGATVYCPTDVNSVYRFENEQLFKYPNDEVQKTWTSSPKIGMECSGIRFGVDMQRFTQSSVFPTITPLQALVQYVRISTTTSAPIQLSQVEVRTNPEGGGALKNVAPEGVATATTTFEGTNPSAVIDESRHASAREAVFSSQGGVGDHWSLKLKAPVALDSIVVKGGSAKSQMSVLKRRTLQLELFDADNVRLATLPFSDATEQTFNFQTQLPDSLWSSERGVDYPGNVISTSLGDSPASCQTKCENADICTGFTFRTSDSLCTLKSALGAELNVATPGVDTYINPSGSAGLSAPVIKYTVRGNSNSPGQNLGETEPRSTIEACQQKCQTAKGCAGFVFDHTTASCQLKTELGEGSYTDGFDTYIMQQPISVTAASSFDPSLLSEKPKTETPFYRATPAPEAA